MNWKSLTNLQTWQDFGKEIIWEAFSPQKNDLPLSWPINNEKLDDITILWPNQYYWPPMHIWVTPLLHGFQKFVNVRIARIPQTYTHVVLFYLIMNGKKYAIAVDMFDKFESINEECRNESFLYFKMQYNIDGYPFSNVIPGGFVSHDEAYHYLPHIRKIRDKNDFLSDVYGRFGTEFAQDQRGKAVSLLSKQKDFRFDGGLNKVRYSRFLREVAGSKICIDIFGNGDFCFRLVDYLAVGTCVISIKHRTAFNAPLVDREHIVYMKDDLSDLISLCNFYLKNDEERERISRNSRGFFDKYLHREQLAAYYLYKFFEKIKTL